jgi:uncharacterized membrane protein YgdD (TMEM256/DUF423 family)
MTTDQTKHPVEAVGHDQDHRPGAASGQAAWWLAGVVGAAAVALGAFGAHGLKATVDDPYLLGLWETGARYHLVHAAALLGVAAHPRQPKLAAALFTAGIVIFAGTLYAMALGGPRWLGAVTPIGGVSLIVGWLALGFSRK